MKLSRWSPLAQFSSSIRSGNNLWGETAQTFRSLGSLPVIHPTVKDTQNTDPTNQRPGLFLSSSTTGLLREGALLPLCLLTRTARIGWYQKDKPSWILLKQEMMGWQWHQLDHMQVICTSLQTDNHASNTSLDASVLPLLRRTKTTKTSHVTRLCLLVAESTATSFDDTYCW